MFLQNFLFLLLCQIFLTCYGHENPCQFPMLKGPCLQSLFRYYYDMETDECKKFTYSGCGGNPNRFIRRQQCRQKCVKDQNKRDSDLAADLTSSSRNPVLERIYKAQRNEAQQPQKENQGHLNDDANFALKSSNDVHSTSGCPICDPLYGSCVNGHCECRKGFKLRGKICVDVNECLLPNACPEFSNCTNTFGSFRCDCPDGKCDQAAEVCDEPFDRRLADVCDENVKEKRFYFDSDSSTCKEFVFAGCESKARNLFVDSHTCEKICAAKVKQHYRENLEKNEQKNVVNVKIETGVGKEENEVHGKIEIPKTTTKSPEIEVTTGKTDREEWNPNEDICIKPFDEVLRLECIEATWTEKFFWNHKAKDCEPFWYDTSCDPKDLFGKNFFDTSGNCLKRCNSTKITTTLPITVTSTQASIVTEKTALVSEKEAELLEVPKRRNRFTVPTDSWIWETTTRSADFWSTRSPIISPNETPQPPPKDFPQIPPTLVTFPPKIPAQKEVEIEVEKVDIKPYDPCFDQLDSKLEEDCKGETWEIRWHFNPQKKSCKRFWWGGCESKSKNFFEDAETCKTICGHRFVSESDGGTHFPITQNIENEIVVTTEATTVKTRKPMEIVEELSTDEVTTRTTATSTTTTTTKRPTITDEQKIWLNADFEESLKLSTFAPIQIHETTEFVQKAVDQAPQETTPTNNAKSFDPCLDPFDIKFESDCSEDNWVARSFFDAEKLDCRRFWYGGCSSKSQNLFQDQNSCRLACAHLIPTVHPPSFISLDGVHSNRILIFFF
ncbi:unnamed protein product, partial [Mesorhabditis belari]|uniref:BPTI/Kunitz inhibitor domain-containing protein n=1 Tax=Mesorhabditis belari TaxID=2138241 RepID=A0AAF3F2U5_9BILA